MYNNSHMCYVSSVYVYLLIVENLFTQKVETMFVIETLEKNHKMLSVCLKALRINSAKLCSLEVCAYATVCVCVCVRACAGVLVSVSVCLFMCACMYVSMCTCMYVCVCACVCAGIRVCVQVCHVLFSVLHASVNKKVQ